MSRTYKDKPCRLTREAYTQDYVYLDGYKYMWRKTTKTKKRKEKDTEDHWMSTPGWWITLTMNRPERRGNKLRERKALFSDIEEIDFPDCGRKPHVYYW